MLLQCANCGAPLDVREDASVVKCAYCGFRTERSRMVTLSPETPPQFAPPRVWRPPPHVPARSDVELAYRKSSGAPAMVVVVGVALVAVGIAAALGLRAHGGMRGVPGVTARGPTLDALARVSLDGTPAELAKRIGDGRVAEKSLYVKVESTQIDQVYYLWDEKAPSHPYFVGVILNQGQSLLSGTCEAIAATVGELRERTWSLGGANVYCDPKSSLSASVTLPSATTTATDARDDRWKARLQTLARLTLAAASGGKPPSRDEIRRSLGAGYAIADLARIDVGADVDGARAMLEKRLGGAVSSSDGVRYELMLGEGPLPRVSLRWENRKAGPLASVSFSTSGWQPLGASQAKLATCLGKTLGAPEVNEVDHVKGTVNYRFRRDEVWLYDASLDVVRANATSWANVVRALDACRGISS